MLCYIVFVISDLMKIAPSNGSALRGQGRFRYFQNPETQADRLMKERAENYQRKSTSFITLK